MKISGAGTVAGGDYNEEIHISGAGHVTGSVRCTTFGSAGSARCDGDVNAAGDISIAGEFKAVGSLHSGEKCKIAGAAKAAGSVKADILSIAGALEVGGDIEAEEVDAHGALNCGGLINAEIINVEFESRSHAAAIGGGKITVTHKKKAGIINLSLFGRGGALGGRNNSFTVDETIEGDYIAIEGVKANTVTGRVVAIGAGCEIDTVRYSEKVEISPEAKVTHVEKE